MGANTKALKNRIRSVDSTLHTTSAMGLVASSKMRRSNERMAGGRQYAAAFADVVDVLAASPECAGSPYMRKTDGKSTRLIVIAGDRGLAGGYNANVFRLTESMEREAVYPIGKRACDRYHGEFASSEYYTGAQATALARKLCAEFVAGEYDRLGIVYTRYVSMLTQEADVKWVLPLTRPETEGTLSVLFEPDEETILNATVPDYIAGLLMALIRESFASEVAARRMAMDSAGKNARAMIDDLQLQYNRARQGAITQEITEIVAGSGA
ncbi:MAG: ATP synthase F1 subunit gamma [Clostridiales bacterium]|nr:ATP synthase F1 subunit gamma [Clostridiales bacterium]